MKQIVERGARVGMLCVFALCVSALVFGQAQPGGEQKGEVDPFGAGAKVEEKAKAEEAKAEVVKAEPLAIQVLRDSNPTTPVELIRAAQAVLQFGRPDECKRYLAKLVASQPSDEALGQLPARFGDFLLKLVRQKDVQPEGKQVSDLVAAAVQRAAQNPERMNALIGQLSAQDRDARSEALARLAESGTAVVTPMLRVLTDGNREKEHVYVQAGLVRLGAVTEAPLIGALESASEPLKAKIIEVLGQMRATLAAGQLVRLAADAKSSAEMRDAAQAALVRIVGAVPGPYEARRYLSQEAARLLRGELPYETDVDNLVELWSWDDGKQELSARRLPKRDAAVWLAARAAKDWYAVSGENTAQRLKLLTSLELAKTLGGLDRPLAMEAGSAGEAAAQAGPQVVSQVLADAMQEGRVPAAIAAVEVLSQIGDRCSLRMVPGGASPLAEAMVFSDRRVRLAAALAAVKLADGESYWGAGRVGPTLAWFVGTGGTSAVLVGHPRQEDAQSLTGLLNSLGYEGRTAISGRAVAQEAFANPDIELALIADSIDGLPVMETVQWLRRDFRTARLPIGVMARSEQVARWQENFKDDPYTRVFPSLHSAETTGREVKNLQAVAGRDLAPRDERIGQALAAIGALAEVAKDKRRFKEFDLLALEPAVIRGLYSPALTARVAELLAQIGTPKAQTALVEFASQGERPLSDRQAAAAAFATAVKSRGLLLTQRQIAAQYERYNASQKQEAATQELLGGILDTIEAPAVARGELSKVE